jgi:hypothetical protein
VKFGRREGRRGGNNEILKKCHQATRSCYGDVKANCLRGSFVHVERGGNSFRHHRYKSPFSKNCAETLESVRHESPIGVSIVHDSLLYFVVMNLVFSFPLLVQDGILVRACLLMMAILKFQPRNLAHRHPDDRTTQDLQSSWLCRRSNGYKFSLN